LERKLGEGIMKNLLSNKQQGQTLIETALILFVLLMILLGIAEFARAWYTKNSLKNAARQGARVAAVTPAANITPTTFNCINPSCPDSNAIQNAVCCQPGIPTQAANATAVNVYCYDKDGNTVACSNIVANGTVKVSMTSTFEFVVGNSPWPWPKTTNMAVDASMRYE
jgi:Flp pilus assembly protein TadG